MRQCEICGKGSLVARKRNKLRGKYNPTEKSRRYPNLQKTRLANGKRILACAGCIKKLAKAGK
ncbi:MAG: hypothetical protein UV58_C0001G0009 [Candidatus Wolfebacteria bacterium GW2011_GWC1_43_10]|uniref:50S ribosomal protein L28 n=2 Tax=Candidatus Wolfeibacteriota TaxID=1752735 RepID=A0A0G1CBZ4_9BACT|nr:MAG: hypothetical protein UV58_C0001G0009 [Candidatus Wolfebacteria bacterium GW2011_GWC1_43_10]KKT22708.1 MAG: hypothetical protein UW08_C0004G0004 [Parcubacteria group bacterium GW2011_GWB1_43_8b]OGM90045.1 MAG: hypothetical protein A2108_01750 [Candidatus Wolfebacteria bacterium GWA1_42_9]